MTTHALVALDGSEQSWKAFEYAISHFEGGEITVLHVVDPTEGFHTGMEGWSYDQMLFENLMDAGEQLCEEAETRAEEADILASTTLNTAVEAGRPARTILEYADDHGVDHIVIGSHGRSGISRVLLGSVAESVTRRAAVPVTVLR